MKWIYYLQIANKRQQKPRIQYEPLPQDQEGYPEQMDGVLTINPSLALQLRDPSKQPTLGFLPRCGCWTQALKAVLFRAGTLIEPELFWLMSPDYQDIAFPAYHTVILRITSRKGSKMALHPSNWRIRIFAVKEAQTVTTECSCEPSTSSLDQSVAPDCFSLSFQWKLFQNILNILNFYIYRVEAHDRWQCRLSV